MNTRQTLMLHEHAALLALRHDVGLIPHFKCLQRTFNMLYVAHEKTASAQLKREILGLLRETEPVLRAVGNNLVKATAQQIEQIKSMVQFAERYWATQKEPVFLYALGEAEVFMKEKR